MEKTLRSELAKLGAELAKVEADRDDARYDTSMDVVGGKLVPLGDGPDTMMEEKERDLPPEGGLVGVAPDPSFEEILEPH
ncbi:hypothetical protein VNO80_15889 [Phaseolus coccineus]|uniref:Uncharacterized protein n=1 Tax=Phaseolus coccineus TaxID=3886 RepID=A0AAN9R3D8_PHACN